MLGVLFLDLYYGPSFQNKDPDYFSSFRLKLDQKHGLTKHWLHLWLQERDGSTLTFYHSLTWKWRLVTTVEKEKHLQNCSWSYSDYWLLPFIHGLKKMYTLVVPVSKWKVRFFIIVFELFWFFFFSAEAYVRYISGQNLAVLPSNVAKEIFLYLCFIILLITLFRDILTGKHEKV